MGIGSDTLALLLALKQQGYLHGRIAMVEIGAQQLANTFLDARDQLAALRDLFGIDKPYETPLARRTHIVHGELEHLDATAPFARDFWTWLGFEYASIDIDGSPGSIPLDLNYDSVPEAAIGKYQMVTNFGTTEHVANQLNAFEIIHNLTALGGVMVHQLPMQGMLNHGLFNYNPKFFWMLARSNGYKFVDINVVASDVFYELPENIANHVSSFHPDVHDRRARHRAADAGIFVVLQKTFDTPYVAPLDVPTGTRTENSALEERYWSVLKPDAWENLDRAMPHKSAGAPPGVPS